MLPRRLEFLRRLRHQPYGAVGCNTATPLKSILAKQAQCCCKPEYIADVHAGFMKLRSLMSILIEAHSQRSPSQGQMALILGLEDRQGVI